MSPIFLILCATLVYSADLPSTEPKESAREEKLRSALIDAFQNIKKGSAKGIDDGSQNSDLLTSMISTSGSQHDKATTEEFELFSDDDGLTFAEAFDRIEPEQKSSSTETSHNVQHIVKTTKQPEKTTSRPNKDREGILSRLSDSIDSIRNTLNETRQAQARQASNDSEFFGIENMLRVFDAEILVKQWGELQRVMSGQCREDVQEYVNGLMEKRLWALKSESFSEIQ